MPRKPKTNTDAELFSEIVAVKMTATMKQRLIQALMRSKRDADTPIGLQLGLSEYIRDVLAAHLESLPKD